MDHPKLFPKLSGYHLLIPQGIPLANKGLTPSGLSFVKFNIITEFLLNLSLTTHTANHKKLPCKYIQDNLTHLISVPAAQ